MDNTDRQILAILQQNARTPNAEIARRVGMAPSAVFERIRKLEERGVIARYQAVVNPRALGLPLVAFVFVRTAEPPGACDAAVRLAAIPGVQEVHHIAGEDCYLVKVRAADPEALGRILREEFGAIGTIRSTRTTIVLETIKETAELPLQPAAAEEVESEAVHG
ncbi:MAG: Lrp/AsnC family transcriptional regulator [bacterium]|mgnify:FL=1|jgi:Lrp/AsnC family leucine-responsive transcriptional regulator|nr:MAG: Lrp/AsnC family transcriptional regulator [bacterium]